MRTQPDTIRTFAGRSPLRPGGQPRFLDHVQADPRTERLEGRFSWPSGRWWWTIGGGVLAAGFAVAGYTVTRRPRHWFSAPR
ncbi:hypothetical protein [Spirillospora sp. CA-128828]|uniref:hypothetical protein n=1 Tax=Spirillospora sp. CA-128828 TaxID=3240033 RepID=UPI003D8DC894